MKAQASDVLASWLTDAPKLFGDDYLELRQPLVHRDTDTVVRILEKHQQLDRLLPFIDDVEVIERAAAHDNLLVVRTLDAGSLSTLWGLTDDLASVDEFA